MVIWTGFVLLVLLLLLLDIWKNRAKSSNKAMEELAERWKTHPEEFMTLAELEEEVLANWEFNKELEELSE